MIIAFVGFMGSGKTTMAKLLAKKYKFKITSIDKKIEENSGKKIKDIFATNGEQYFRDLEYNCIKESVNKMTESNQNYALDLGGGAFIQERNRDFLKGKVTAVFLDVPFEILCSRLQNEKDNRPMLKKDNFREEAKKLYDYRLPFYKMADFTLNERSNNPRKNILVVEKMLGLNNK